jgi:hypothetical protein
MENRMIHNPLNCNLSLTVIWLELLDYIVDKFFYSCLQEASIWFGLVFNAIYVQDLWFWYRITDFNLWFYLEMKWLQDLCLTFMIRHMMLSCYSEVRSFFYFWNSACKLRGRFTWLLFLELSNAKASSIFNHVKATNLKKKICIDTAIFILNGRYILILLDSPFEMWNVPLSTRFCLFPLPKHHQFCNPFQKDKKLETSCHPTPWFLLSITRHQLSDIFTYLLLIHV